MDMFCWFCLCVFTNWLSFDLERDEQREIQSQGRVEIITLKLGIRTALGFHTQALKPKALVLRNHRDIIGLNSRGFFTDAVTFTFSAPNYFYKNCIVKFRSLPPCRD